MKNIRKDFEKRFKDLEQRYKYLENHKDTKDIFMKLRGMDSQFLYGCFKEIFYGFGTLEGAEHICHTLSYCLLDDGCLTLQNRKKKNQFNGSQSIETYISTDDSGKWLNQKDLLNYIDSKEKKEIKYIQMCYQFDPEDISCFKETIKNFNEENLNLLSNEIKEKIYDI